MLESIEKVPPQNLEAEAALLGSMLLEEDAIAQAIELVDEGSFYSAAHKQVFCAIINLYNNNKPVDLITLTDELKRTNALDSIGGVSFLTGLVNLVPTAANVGHYAKIVKEKSILRYLINDSTRIITEAFESEVNADELLDKAEKLIFDIGEHRLRSEIVPLKEIIHGSMENIDRLYQRKSHVTGVPTGFIDFDMITSGLQNSDLIIIAGRPSMGKSAFALQMAEYAAVVEKLPVAFFSLEMSAEQLVHRLLCSHARVNAHSVRTGYLSTSDWPRLTAAAGKLSEANIFVDDTSSISALELRAKARRLKAQYDIKLMIVDYLQMMRASGRFDNRQQEISEISRSLKSLARELKVPLIAVSQLSRAVESRTDHIPQLSDLRESGAIEQDADVVVFLLREEYYNPTEDNKGKAEARIAKQRNGPVGSVELAFIREYMRFENLARSE